MSDSFQNRLMKYVNEMVINCLRKDFKSQVKAEKLFKSFILAVAIVKRSLYSYPI
jgi:hypothetical protein